MKDPNHVLVKGAGRGYRCIQCGETALPTSAKLVPCPTPKNYHQLPPVPPAGRARGLSMPPKTTAFTIRIRTQLHKKLLREAKANNRSLTAQVEFDLMKVYR